MINGKTNLIIENRKCRLQTYGAEKKKTEFRISNVNYYWYQLIRPSSTYRKLNFIFKPQKKKRSQCLLKICWLIPNQTYTWTRWVWRWHLRNDKISRRNKIEFDLKLFLWISEAWVSYVYLLKLIPTEWWKWCGKLLNFPIKQSRERERKKSATSH